MNKGMRAALIGTVLVLATLGGMFALLFHKTPQLVETAAIDRGEVRSTIEVESRTRLRQHYVITAPVAGVLQRVQLEVGDRVKQGQVLARIEPLLPTPLDARTRRQTEADYRAARDQIRAATSELSAAIAESKQRKADFERLQKLAHQQHVSESDREQAETAMHESRDQLHARQAQLALAKSKAASLKALLEDYRQGEAKVLDIPSPIGGMVMKRDLQSSQTVTAGQPILTLGDMRSMEVAIDALTQTAARVHPGTPVDFLRWGGKPLHGKVWRIEPDGYTKYSALGVEEQHVWVLAEVSHWPPQLGEGFRLDAQLELARKNNVLRVPNSATFRTHGDTWQVYLMQDGEAVARTVELGLQGDDYSEVLKGLRTGETVIIHPSSDLVSGEKVERAFSKK